MSRRKRIDKLRGPSDKETWAIIRDNLYALTRAQVRVLELYYADGKSVSEIAFELHLSPSAISGRLQRGRERLHRHMRTIRRETLRDVRELDA